MFSLSRKLKSQASDDSAAEQTVARIAITESGEIAYASPAFQALAGFTETTNVDAAGFVKFPEADTNFPDIGPGTHNISINGHKNLFSFHFDWLKTKDNKRYLVGSEVRGAAKPDPKSFEPKIIEAIQQTAPEPEAVKPTPAPTPAPAAPKGSDADLFMHLSRDIMLAASDDGDIIRVNERFASSLGYSPEKIAGLNLVDIFHPEDKPYVRNAVRSLTLEGGREVTPPLDFEARVITGSGEERWMEWRQMRSNGLTYCLGHDITHIKKQERALNRREGQLREAESIGNMGRWRWGIGDEFLDWSDEVYRIFGKDKREFKPTLDGMRALIKRADIARVNQAFQRAMIERNDYDMEFRVPRADGERFIRCEGRCAINSEGEAVALYGVMQDVTERMQHEKELRAAKDSAERAYAAKSQFLANMSHELRTPLNAVIGFSEMMQRQLLGPIGTPKYLEYITGIRESGEHLLDIINDILVMSKIEAGKYELMLEEVNVLKITKLAVHMMEGKAMDSEIKMSIEPPKNESRFIIADRRAVLQVLLNVLSNAVKFSPRGGKVAVECHERGNYVSFKIIDNGVGIPANKLASITKPFEQVQSHYSREHEGTGLGLAITKDLVEMHGGSLLIDSTVGAGTTVTVRMPYDGSKGPSKK